MQYVHWLLSFTIIFLRFTCVVAVSEAHSLLRLFHCMHISYLFIHSPFDVFTFLVIVDILIQFYRVRGKIITLNVETRKREFSFE